MAEEETLDLDGVEVRFPYAPYDVQRTYMAKVIECLKEKRFGCLESPTGTGKTLALLCASLAWLQSQRGGSTVPESATNGENNSAPAFNNGIDADIQALVKGTAPPPGGGGWGPGAGPIGGAAGGPGPPPAKLRIVYASRTHSQLAQVIHEFRRCPYSHVSSVILASREQLCINEQLAHVADKNQMCRVKIRTRSCQYYNNIERNTGGASAGTSSALGPSGSSGSDHLTVGIGDIE